MGYIVRIKVKNGQQIREYTLDDYGKDVIVFGRKTDCDIVFSNPKVSGRHGCLYKENGEWYIQDLNSTNGVLRNGARITSSKLHQNDRIILDSSEKPDSLKMIIRKVPREITNNGNAFEGQKASAAVHYLRPEQPKQEEEKQIKHSADGPAAGNAPKNSKTAVVAVILAAAALLVAGGIFLLINRNKGGTGNTEGKSASGEPAAEKMESSGEDISGEQIYETASRSTVEVMAEKSEYMASIGTGFFVDDKGTVVTNYHVIDGAYTANITLSNGDVYRVTGVAAYDPDKDIAVLETEAADTKPLPFRTEEIKTGEKVYALGSSQGLTGTFSDGIVSQASRFENGMAYIQHTAPITNGNSGGPLLDTQGRVIGINTWGYVDGQNLNFAIPIGEVERLPRNSAITLSSVYENEYGRSYSEIGGISASSKSVVLSRAGDKQLEVNVPQEMDITNDGEDKTADYDGDDCMMRVFGAIDTGSSMDAEGWEYAADYLTEYLNDEYSQYGISFDDGQIMEMDISGQSWVCISIDGYGDDADMEVRMLEHQEGYTQYRVCFMTLIANDQDYVDNWLTLYDMRDEIMSSIRLQ